MEALYERLYLELRQSEDEIKESLITRQNHDWLSLLLEEELADISFTIRKMEKGKFGLCEISGELLPVERLKSVPTLKSVKDLQSMDSYFRKPIH
jgi:RNA polymerase-binding transcription factor DksA